MKKLLLLTLFLIALVGCTTVTPPPSPPITALDTLTIGDGVNQTTIGKDGLLLEGDATVYSNVRVIPAIKATGSNDPAFTKYFDNGAGSRGVYAWAMTNAVAGSQKEIHFSLQLPNNWKEGTNITPTVDWFPVTAGGSGTAVRWGLECNKANTGSTLGNTNIIYTTQVLSGNISVAKNYMTSHFTDMSMSGNTVSTVLMCRLFRDSAHALDTYTGVAGLLFIDFNYEIDSLGSKEKYVK